MFKILFAVKGWCGYGQKNIQMIRVDKEIMSPSEYLALLKEEKPNSIKKVKIVTSRMGSDSFGRIEVTYNSPGYVMG